jgi:hypothetical protein
MTKVLYKNLAMMVMFKKQKRLLDKSMHDYLRKESYKDKYDRAIINYEKPYSDIAIVNTPLKIR